MNFLPKCTKQHYHGFSVCSSVENKIEKYFYDYKNIGNMKLVLGKIVLKSQTPFIKFDTLSNIEIRNLFS